MFMERVQEALCAGFPALPCGIPLKGIVILFEAANHVPHDLEGQDFLCDVVLAGKGNVSHVTVVSFLFPFVVHRFRFWDRKGNVFQVTLALFIFAFAVYPFRFK